MNDDFSRIWATKNKGHPKMALTCWRVCQQDFLSLLCQHSSMKSRKSLRPLAFLFSPAYGVVFSGNTRLGQGVEQRGFSDVGQAYDSAFERHEKVLMNQHPCCPIGPNVGIVEVPEPLHERGLCAKGKSGEKPRKGTKFCPCFAWVLSFQL